MQLTKAAIGFKSFLRSLIATIAAAAMAVYSANNNAPFQDYERAILAAPMASILKGVSSMMTAKDVTVVNQ